MWMWSIILNTNSVFGFICWLREAEGLYTSIGRVDLYLESYLNTIPILGLSLALTLTINT